MFPLHTETQQVSPEAEYLIQPVLDTLSGHIAILNDCGEIIAVNAAWRKLAYDDIFTRDSYGIGQSYVTACQRSTCLNLPDAAQTTVGIYELIDGKRDLYRHEYPAQTPLERRWFLLRASRFVLQGELRIIVIHQDLDDLKDAQQKLAESQQAVQLSLDQSPTAVLTVAPDGRIESCDALAERIFGFGRDELAGTYLTRILSDPRYHGDNLHEFNGNHGHKLTGRRRNGDEFPMVFKLDKIHGYNGGLCTVTAQDMTENEQRENQAARGALDTEQEPLQMDSHFLSLMAHELRTPLASIRLSYDMLTHYGKQATEDEHLQYLDNIRLQVDHLNEVVGDVMSLSKANRGELEFNPERGDLTTFCHNIVESFQINHLRSHNVVFECPVAELFVDFDRRLLRRAVTNLTDNAIKYSPQGGNVLFRLWQEDNRAHMTVSDQGIGIPPDEAEFLFDAFHRASNVGSLPGTGLGLAIAKQAVERHGGEISLPPQSAVGATFCIELPLHAGRL